MYVDKPENVLSSHSFHALQPNADRQVSNDSAKCASALHLRRVTNDNDGDGDDDDYDSQLDFYLITAKVRMLVVEKLKF